MQGYEAHITETTGQGRLKYGLTRIIVPSLLLLIAVFLPFEIALAQIADSPAVVPGQEINENGNNGPRDIFIPSPTKAAMLSATLPGLGQIYNRKYWKLPVIYTGFGALAYLLDFNNGEYRKWREAWISRVDGNPNTTDDFPNHSTDWLERAMNHYRRNLEVTYLLAGALYLLNILDASVDAHLMNFDIGEDLSLGIEPVSRPSMNNPGYKTHSAQLSLRIRF